VRRAEYLKRGVTLSGNGRLCDYATEGGERLNPQTQPKTGNKHKLISPMKSKLSSVLFSTLLAASALLAVQVRAEDGPGGPPPGGEYKKGGEKGKMASPGERVEKMKEHLGLSDDQAAQVKEILGAELKEMQALRTDESVPVEQKKEKAKAIREAAKAKVDAVLTAEQLAKAEAARGKMADLRDRKKEKGPKGEKGPKTDKPAAE